jgi:hypothetical protein
VSRDPLVLLYGRVTDEHDRIEAEEVDDPPPKNFLAKVGQALF